MTMVYIGGAVWRVMMGYRTEEERVVVKCTTSCDAAGCGRELAKGATYEEMKSDMEAGVMTFLFNRGSDQHSIASIRLFVCRNCYTNLPENYHAN